MNSFDIDATFNGLTAQMDDEARVLQATAADMAWEAEPRPVPAGLAVDRTSGAIPSGHIALMGDFEAK